MLSSKWRVRSHRYFGTVQVPIVEVEIKSLTGQFFPFALCVDSGAVVSLLPRSAADVLGLDPSGGRPIQLGIVSEHRIDAWIHELDVRIGDMPPMTVPFAVAVHDNVPALLGRMGVFDRLEITFNPAERTTDIRLP